MMLITMLYLDAKNILTTALISSTATADVDFPGMTHSESMIKHKLTHESDLVGPECYR